MLIVVSKEFSAKSRTIKFSDLHFPVWVIDTDDCSKREYSKADLLAYEDVIVGLYKDCDIRGKSYVSQVYLHSILDKRIRFEGGCFVFDNKVIFRVSSLEMALSIDTDSNENLIYMRLASPYVYIRGFIGDADKLGSYYRFMLYITMDYFNFTIDIRIEALFDDHGLIGFGRITCLESSVAVTKCKVDERCRLSDALMARLALLGV